MSKHYAHLDVNEYVSVPDKYSYDNIAHMYYTGKIPKLSAYYNVNEHYMTRTSRYLFYVELELYYDEFLKRAIRNLQTNTKIENYEAPNAYLDDDNNNYDFERAFTGNGESYIYHIKIDARHDNFEESIKLIRRSPFYISDYVHSIDPAVTVVQLKTICRDRINKFLQNRYSELYQEREYEALTHNPFILLSYFDANSRHKMYEFTDSSAVLLGLAIDFAGESEAERIIKDLNIDDEDTKKVIRERHKSYSIDKIKKHGQTSNLQSSFERTH